MGKVAVTPNTLTWNPFDLSQPGSVPMLSVASALEPPKLWTAGSHVVVDPETDLFGGDHSVVTLATLWAVMAMNPDQTFRIRTSNAVEMQQIVSMKFTPGGNLGFEDMVRNSAHNLRNAAKREDWPWADDLPWPLPNVWLGVDTPHQHALESSITALMETPAAIRWLNANPLFGRLTMHPYWLFGRPHWGEKEYEPTPNGGRIAMQPLVLSPKIDWVVVGGDVGELADPLEPKDVRSLIDQCSSADIPVLFESWGDYTPVCGVKVPRLLNCRCVDSQVPHPLAMKRVGVANSGRSLDGREWNEYPVVEAADD